VYRQQRATFPFPLLRRLILAGFLLAACLPTPACAQTPAQRLLSGLLSNGAYFFTDSSGRNALGSVQFYNEILIYGRPKTYGGVYQVSGGLEISNASDHFFPFTGGNQFSLIGPSVRITTKRTLGRLRPYFSAGLFVGNLTSDRIGVNSTDFTPSLSFGAEWPFARYFTLSVGYRLMERIGGVNTDGFTLMLRIF
jgi:hypothetical protein